MQCVYGCRWRCCARRPRGGSGWHASVPWCLPGCSALLQPPPPPLYYLPPIRSTPTTPQQVGGWGGRRAVARLNDRAIRRLFGLPPPSPLTLLATVSCLLPLGLVAHSPCYGHDHPALSLTSLRSALLLNAPSPSPCCLGPPPGPRTLLATVRPASLLLRTLSPLCAPHSPSSRL